MLVQGFTQTYRSWSPLLPALAEHEVLFVDAHLPLDLPTMGAHLAEHGPATFVGYSMGGRMCLHVPPSAMTGLVLISATAGIDDLDERAARRRSDEALADRIEQIGAHAFLEEWLAQPMFAGLRDPGPRCTDAGTLATSLRLAGTGTQVPQWDRLHEITCPVLLVAGALDLKFVALAQRLHDALPDSTLAVVEGAGHTVHLERPDAFLDVLLPWLTR